MSKKGLEIKQEIDLRNKLIQEALTLNVFVLNNTVNQLMKEIDELQIQCLHEYDEDGFCIYCNKILEE